MLYGLNETYSCNHIPTPTTLMKTNVYAQLSDGVFFDFPKCFVLVN